MPIILIVRLCGRRQKYRSWLEVEGIVKKITNIFQKTLLSNTLRSMFVRSMVRIWVHFT
jgi:arsenate reductase-like glutaredoxin family protein